MDLSSPSLQVGPDSLCFGETLSNLNSKLREFESTLVPLSKEGNREAKADGFHSPEYRTGARRGIISPCSVTELRVIRDPASPNLRHIGSIKLVWCHITT